MYLHIETTHNIAIAPFLDTSQIRSRVLMHQRRMRDASNTAESAWIAALAPQNPGAFLLIV
jgi:hypothetical protein